MTHKDLSPGSILFFEDKFGSAQYLLVGTSKNQVYFLLVLTTHYYSKFIIKKVHKKLLDGWLLQKSFVVINDEP